MSTGVFGQTAPFGYLDSAANSQGNTTIPYNSTLIVKGWAADNEDTAPVSKVQIFIDGKPVATATLGGERPDVAAAFSNPAFLKSGWTASVSLANVAAGSHTVSALASDSSMASATLIGTPTFIVVAPDLSINSLAVSGTPVAGGSLSVTAITSNVGSMSAGAFMTRFYLNSIAAKGGTLLPGGPWTTALNAGASLPVSTSVTLPAGVSGKYYLVACANDTRTVVDSNTSNDCASVQISVGGPDLSENITGPATATAGGTIQVVDTVTNSGAGSAGFSVTRFYLSKDTSKSTTLLGKRSVMSVVAGGTSTGTTSLVLPGGTAGNNYIVACANDTNTVSDLNPANNCNSTPITISGADLAANIVHAPTTAFAGDTIEVSDSVSNLGLGSAGWSLARIYLNTSPVRGGTVIASRSINSIGASATYGPVSSSFTLGSSISGLHYLVACANETNTVVETSTANNCSAVPLSVYLPANSVVVDPTRAATPYEASTCGSLEAACNSITDGVARAQTGQAVLVFPGVYVEQVSIRKNIDLVSAVKNQAVIKAPEGVKLSADPDGHQVLLTITGGATVVNVKDMTIAGPVYADSCADNFYGIYVKNANADLSGNKIDSIQHANSALWGCQPGVGIRFGSRALGYVGHKGTIGNNTIIAPAKGGIVVDGDGTDVNVTGNTITGLNVVGVVGQNGIQISRGARGIVDKNTVGGFRYGATLNALSAAGILVYDVAGGVIVTNNIVSGNDEGIGVYSAGTASQYPTNVKIQFNTVSGNVYLGIHIDPFSTGNTIWNNTAFNNDGGWDELDEHSDFNSNDWGSIPSQYNSVGSVHSGLVFSY